MRRPSRWFAAAMLAVCASVSTDAQTAYPSAATVPVNLLRISIEFPTQPPTDVADRVRLTRSDGTEIEHAFYPQPLWSPDGRKLTLYLDPGRVKTGLIAHDAAGRALTSGEAVELRLADLVLRRWRVAAARTEAIDPRRWSIQAPVRGSRAALSVNLVAPLDRRAASLVAVADAAGNRVEGSPELVAGETIWRFVPDYAWRPGRYSLRLHPDLEDPEGNRVGRPFEAKTVADGVPPALGFSIR